MSVCPSLIFFFNEGNATLLNLCMYYFVFYICVGIEFVYLDVIKKGSAYFG